MSTRTPKITRRSALKFPLLAGAAVALAAQPALAAPEPDPLTERLLAAFNSIACPKVRRMQVGMMEGMAEAERERPLCTGGDRSWCGKEHPR